MTRRRLLLVALLAAVTCAGGLTPVAASSTATATTVGFTFVPPVISIAPGDSLQLTNSDLVPHNLHSAPDGSLFHSPDVAPGTTAPVADVESLPAGQYPFYCTIHPWMQGVLDVGTLPGLPTLPPVVLPDTGALPVGGAVVTPTSLVAHDGSMYVASYATGVVSQMSILPGGLLGPPTPYASGFTNPLGITFDPADGTLFVADSHPSATPGRTTDGRVWAVDPGGATKAVVIDGLPNGRHNTNGMEVHGARLFIANGNSTDNGGPDSPGGPGDVPDRSGALLSVPVDARGLTSVSPEVVVEATGMRNVYDVAFRPGTDEAWMTMNGPDTFDPFGEDLLLKADVAGAAPDFGFPGCIYGRDGQGAVTAIDNDQIDRSCGTHQTPEQLLGLHVSADGLVFHGGYIYIAEFGNFFGNEVVGHRVVRVPVGSDGVSGPPQDVIVGAAPLDVTATDDGVYIADFATGQITLLRTSLL